MDFYSTLLGASLFTLLLLLAIAIVIIAGKWKVYAKLGMPGWYWKNVGINKKRFFGGVSFLVKPYEVNCRAAMMSERKI